MREGESKRHLCGRYVQEREKKKKRMNKGERKEGERERVVDRVCSQE